MSPGDWVVDPFCGCGTTSLEAYLQGRNALGGDINPVATMIASAKTSVIEPSRLQNSITWISQRLTELALSSANTDETREYHQRIDYWFKPNIIQRLLFITSLINEITEPDLRTFFQCSLSNILKNASIWKQRSTKPTRDLNKVVTDPFKSFIRHLNYMAKGNQELYELIQNRSLSKDLSCSIHTVDARDVPIESGKTDLIVTSPPYVTSYEYADLHQLSAIWFNFVSDLGLFRKSFVGTSHVTRDHVTRINSNLASDVLNQLQNRDRSKVASLSLYFSEMYQCFVEFNRILKHGGKACIVIGNTAHRGVKIPTAEIFVEQLDSLGFNLEDVIVREIPSKLLPTVRDSKTGRFTSETVNESHTTEAYPKEYILILSKGSS